MNRMRPIWLGQAPGAQAPSSVKVLTDQTIGEALAAPKAVVMLYSPNCPYSRSFMPIYQSLASQNPDVLFASVIAEENLQTAGKYNLRMMPTVVFFVNGQEVNRIDGVQDASDFNTQMNKAFSSGKAAAAPAAVPYEREGTSVEEGVKPAAYVVGGVVGAGILGLLGYLAFGK